MTEPSSPALIAIWRAGQDSALRTISTPVFWSSFLVRKPLRCSEARSRATPPPGTMPSSTAATLSLLAAAPARPATGDPRDPARELGQPLLQLLTVVVRGGFLDLRLDLIDACFDVGLLAGAVDDGGVFLVDHHLLGAAKHGERDVLEL